MEPLIFAKILTVHNVVYFILSTAIAAALLHKSKLPNFPHMVWAIPTSWIALAILFWLLGGLFKVVIPLLLVIVVVVAVVIFVKKGQTT